MALILSAVRLEVVNAAKTLTPEPDLDLGYNPWGKLSRMGRRSGVR